MSRSSAAAVAAALWLGTIIGGPWWTVVPGVLVLAAAGRGVRGRGARCSARARVSAGLLGLTAAGLILVGAGLTGGRVAMRDGGVLSQRLHDGARDVVGIVVTEPRRGAFESWMIVRLESVDGLAVRQRALLRSAAPPAVGTRLQLRARVETLDDGGFGGYVRSLGAGWTLAPVGQIQSVERPSWALRGTTRVRERLRTVAAAALPADHATILTGLVTGDARGRSAQVDDLLEDAGLRHLVVVSGRHTALFLAGVFGLATLTRLSFRVTRLVTVGALCWFVILVRWQPSVLRAATVAGLVLVADLLGRDRNSVHLLCMAIVLLLLADPLLGRQLGFVLSVAATAGVLIVGPEVGDRLTGPRWLRLGIAAAVGAQLAVAPVLLASGKDIPVAGVAANLVAAPAAAVAQILGSLAALVALVSVDVARFILTLAAPSLDVILRAARAAAAAPSLGEAATVPAALVLCALLAGVMTRQPRLVGAAAVAALMLLWRPPGQAHEVTTLTVTAFDVGQGDALLVESPGDDGAARMLVDGGPDPERLSRELLRRGVRYLDAVVVTHPHEDHSAGVAAVLEHIDTGALLLGPGGAREEQAFGPTDEASVARRVGTPVIEVSSTIQFPLGNTRVRVLGPPANTSGWDTNDRSIVLHVDGPWGDALLTGDIEHRAQRWLLRQPEALEAAVLKVPHHGGATNADRFLAAIGADIALVSVGAGNDYGHPSPQVLDALAPSQVWRTDRSGTVRVELGPDGPLVTARSR